METKFFFITINYNVFLMCFSVTDLNGFYSLFLQHTVLSKMQLKILCTEQLWHSLCKYQFPGNFNKGWLLYQGNWTFWLDFQHFGMSEMETGVAVCDTEQMATCGCTQRQF